MRTNVLPQPAPAASAIDVSRVRSARACSSVSVAVDVDRARIVLFAESIACRGCGPGAMRQTVRKSQRLVQLSSRLATGKLPWRMSVTKRPICSTTSPRSDSQPSVGECWSCEHCERVAGVGGDAARPSTSSRPRAASPHRRRRTAALGRPSRRAPAAAARPWRSFRAVSVGRLPDL